MRAALRNVAVLAGLALLAGGAIGWFAAFTADDVRRNRIAAEMHVLRELAGIVAPHGVDIDIGDGEVLACLNDLAVVRGVGKGYGGEFRIAVAIKGGAVAGVGVLEHAETPGFGDILDAGSAWLESFKTDDVHAVTGATVTSQAVMRAVAATLARFEAGGFSCESRLPATPSVESPP